MIRDVIITDRHLSEFRDGLMQYAGATAIVKEVSFYHGGDQLYVLENVPGIWNEPCLEPVP